MKRISVWMILAALLLANFPADAFERNDFDKIVDFSTTLKNLDDSHTAAASIRNHKLFILNGTVAGIQILNPDPDGFAAQVELVTGEWVGLEEIRSHRCLVLFQGPEFYKYFPKKNASTTPDSVKQNNRILVVVRALEQVSIDSTQKIWVLKGFHVRPLQ